MANPIEWKGTRNSYTLGDPSAQLAQANKTLRESLLGLAENVGTVDDNFKEANNARLLETMRKYQTADEMRDPIAQADIMNTMNKFGTNIDRQAALLYEQAYTDQLSKRDTATQALAASKYELGSTKATAKLTDMLMTKDAEGIEAAKAEALANGFNVIGAANDRVSNSVLLKGQSLNETNKYEQAVKNQQAAGIAQLFLSGKTEEANSMVANDPELAYKVSELITGRSTNDANLERIQLANEGQRTQNQMGNNALNVSNLATNNLLGTSNEVSPKYKENVSRLDNDRMRATLTKYDANIQKYSKEFGVPPELVAIVLSIESGGNPNVKDSPKQARGLMQTIKSTYNAMVKGTAYAGVSFDKMTPEASLFAGIKYLAQQYNANGGDFEKTLIAYNAGPGNLQKAIASGDHLAYIRKYEGFAETVKYLEKAKDLRTYLSGGPNSSGGGGGGGASTGGRIAIPNVDGSISYVEPKEPDHTKNPQVMQPAHQAKLKADIAKATSGNKDYTGNTSLNYTDFKAKVIKEDDSLMFNKGTTNYAAVQALDLAIHNKKIKNWDKIPISRQGAIAEEALLKYYPAKMVNSFGKSNHWNYEEVIERVQQSVDAELIRQNTAKNALIDTVNNEAVAELIGKYGISAEQSRAMLGIAPKQSKKVTYDTVDDPFAPDPPKARPRFMSDEDLDD